MSTSLTVLVFGSRNWTDKARIREVLEKCAFPEGTLFIHGDNGYDANGRMLGAGRPDSEAVRGADKLAGAVAQELGFDVIAYPANWLLYGASAGPRRNSEMARTLEQSKPARAICFSELPLGRGSADMMRKCATAGADVSGITSAADERAGGGKQL